MWANEDIDGLNLMFTPPGEARQSGGAWEHRSVRSAQGPTPPFIASTLQRFNAPPPVILGVPFDNVTLGEAVRRVEAMIASRRPHYAVTANVDFLVQARHDLELRRILLQADLVLCDGAPLVWVSRLLKNPLPERVAGSDLAPRLIELAAQKNYRLFLLGGTRAVSAEAVNKLQVQYPKLNISHYSPPFRTLLEMDHAEIIRQIRAARPDLLFVSFGCPKAEKWIAMRYKALGVPVAMGVGATIDFLAGRLERAPLWMQRNGLEWVFRLLQEPGRLFGRYATDFWRFGWAILAQWWRMQLRGSVCLGPIGRTRPIRRTLNPVMVEPTWQRLEAPDWLDADAVRREAPRWEQIGSDDRHCLLEMEQVQFLDSTGVGLLVRLHKRLRDLKRFLVLLEPSGTVRRTLKLMRLEVFFLTASSAVEARRVIETREEEQARPVVIGGPAQAVLWRGEITAANAGAVWKATRAEIKSFSAWRKQWVVDLSGVRFVDSTGALLMGRLQQYARRKGADLRFTDVPENVRQVLRASGLEGSLLGSAQARPRGSGGAWSVRAFRGWALLRSTLSRFHAARSHGFGGSA